MPFDESREKEKKKKKGAIEAAMAYLAAMDRASGEIEAYLKKKEYTAREIEEALQYLKGMNYVNDEAYAQRYLEYAMQKGKGTVKIKGELIQKGISKSLIEKLFLEDGNFSKENEKERALALAEKLADGLGDSFLPCEGDDYDTKRLKYKEKQKQMAKLCRKLAGKGYPPEVAISAVNKVFNKFS